MPEKQYIMSSDFVGVGESLVGLMEVNEPGEGLGVSGDDWVLVLVFLRGEVTAVFDVLDTQGRLELDLVAFLFEGSERVQLEHQVDEKFIGKLDPEGTKTTIRAPDTSRKVIERIHMPEDDILTELNILTHTSK